MGNYSPWPTSPRDEHVHYFDFSILTGFSEAFKDWKPSSCKLTASLAFVLSRGILLLFKTVYATDSILPFFNF